MAKSEQRPPQPNSRRNFLKLSSALAGVGMLGACRSTDPKTDGPRAKTREESLAVWKRGAGTPYQNPLTPGVLSLIHISEPTRPY